MIATLLALSSCGESVDELGIVDRRVPRVISPKTNIDLDQTAGRPQTQFQTSSFRGSLRSAGGISDRRLGTSASFKVNAGVVYR
jgi:hypothetical protein